MYPKEQIDPKEVLDDGTMQENVDALASHVVGHRIVRVDAGPLPDPSRYRRYPRGMCITLDNGKQVVLANTDDCCAFTEIQEFLLNVDKIDHMILGVGTTDQFETWHIFADFGDVMKMKVGWSCGNPFYYGYGFDISVSDIND